MTIETEVYCLRLKEAVVANVEHETMSKRDAA
jgi:hypothetical protein